MYTLIHALILSSVALALVSGAVQPSAGDPVTDPEAYAVYAAIVPNQWPIRVAKARRLAVSESTGYLAECLPSGGPMETTWKPVLESFKRENANPRRILSDRQIGVPYVVLAAEATQQFFVGSSDLNASWQRFYEAHPESGGITSWSAVGFDADKRRALVYVGHGCGSLCGEGHYVFMEKQGSAWRPIELPKVKSCFVVS